jgi:hypothetical protein
MFFFSCNFLHVKKQIYRCNHLYNNNFLIIIIIIILFFFNGFLKKKEMHNDPSAGSPTDALLRLLFPLDHTVRLSFYRK